jgi:hypothetical protein
MAKRSRGSTRPGQRRPLQRPSRSAAATPPRVRPASLTPEEEARAAELEAQLLKDERAAETAQRQARERDRRAAEREPVARVAAGSSLAARAADEYAYVARDARRIIVIAGGLLAIMIGLWIAMQVTGTGTV